MKHEIEAGERMTFDEEDAIAGRLYSQRRAALDAKKVRSYLISNPGANTSEIRKATGVEHVSASLHWLRKRGLIKYTLTGPIVVPL
jgi:hypothetical protein